VPPTSEGAVPSASRFFFIHVMKTGGLAVFTNLSKNFAPDEVYPHPTVDLGDVGSSAVRFRPFTIDYLRSLSHERRCRIRFYAGHFPYIACELLGGWFATITILREPIARTISLLRQFQRYDHSPGSGGQPPSATLPLEEIYELPHVYQPLVHNHQTKIFSMTAADQPSGYMQTIDVDETRLALAKSNLDTVDVVGLTERHDDFVDELADRYGWRLKQGVRANAAPEEPPHISESFRRRIATDNAIDLDFYEYARQLVDSRSV